MHLLSDFSLLWNAMKWLEKLKFLTFGLRAELSWKTNLGNKKVGRPTTHIMMMRWLTFCFSKNMICLESKEELGKITDDTYSPKEKKNIPIYWRHRIDLAKLSSYYYIARSFLNSSKQEAQRALLKRSCIILLECCPMTGV